MDRWTSAYTFRWRPVLTFGAKAAAFFEWVENNTAPLAFASHDDAVGLAFQHPAIRLSVDRRGFTIEDGAAHGNPLAVVRPAIEGLLKAFEPSELTLGSAVTAWSQTHPRDDYDEACKLFAQRLAGPGVESPILTTDASVLADFTGPGWDAQAEWGVVEATELGDVLTRNQIGRLAANLPELDDDVHAQTQFPSVAVFVETVVRFPFSGSLTTISGIDNAVSSVDKLGEALASQLVVGVTG